MHQRGSSQVSRRTAMVQRPVWPEALAIAFAFEKESSDQHTPWHRASQLASSGYAGCLAALRSPESPSGREVRSNLARLSGTGNRMWQMLGWPRPERAMMAGPRVGLERHLVFVCLFS